MAGLRPYDSRRREQLEARSKRARRLGIAAAVTAGVLILATAAVQGERESIPPGSSGPIVIATLLTAALGLAVVFGLEAAQTKRWGKPTITTPEGGFEIGETATAEFRLQGKTFPKPPNLSAKLICREEATHSKGDSVSTETEAVYGQHCVSTPRHVDDGLAFDIEIAIPDHGPASMDLWRNKLVWELDLRVEARDRLALQQTFPLTVQPVLHADAWKYDAEIGTHDDKLLVECGGEISGTASFAELPRRPRRLVAELRYDTEGKGDVESTVVDSMRIPGIKSGDFRWTLRVPPDAPLSYDGSLIKVAWTVRAHADMGWKHNPEKVVAVRVVPSGAVHGDGYEPRVIEREGDEALPPYEPQT